MTHIATEPMSETEPGVGEILAQLGYSLSKLNMEDRKLISSEFIIFCEEISKSYHDN